MIPDNKSDDYEDVKFEMKISRRTEYDFDDFDYNSKEMRTSESLIYPVQTSYPSSYPSSYPFMYQMPQMAPVAAIPQMTSMQNIQNMMEIPQRMIAPMAMPAMPVQTIPMMQPATISIPMQVPAIQMSTMQMMSPMMQYQNYQNPLKFMQTSSPLISAADMSHQIMQYAKAQPHQNQNSYPMYMMPKQTYIPSTPSYTPEVKKIERQPSSIMNHLKWNFTPFRSYAPQFVQKYASYSNPGNYKYFSPPTTTTTTERPNWLSLTNPWVTFYNSYLKEKLPFIPFI